MQGRLAGTLTPPDAGLECVVARNHVQPPGELNPSVAGVAVRRLVGRLP